MTEAGKRIEKVIIHLGLNKNSFSREIGLTNNVTIGRILNEERNPHPSTLQKIVGRFPHISYNWLLTGEGSMIKEPCQSAKKAEAADFGDLLGIIRMHEEQLKQYGEELKKQGERLDRMLDLVSGLDKASIGASSRSKLRNSPPLGAI